MSSDDAVKRFRALPIIAHALQRLSRELSADLFYHSAAHTDDVFSEVLRFAIHDGLPERSQELLAIAAAYHDMGFVVRPTDNEGLGADLAVAALDSFGGYADWEREAVRAAILDTQVKMTASGPRQVSTTQLSNYLLDADVSNLGREDFFEKVELIRREVGAQDARKFLQGVQVFLESHQWYSPAAKALRSQGKDRNRALVVEKLKG